ncbi:GtrA family protein [Hyphomicrobium sp.]|uniref:GtrA family protein n=1 Tax=Hyphomicrobium sp. TaxID=82 RepID=UPI003D097AD9
MGRDSAAGAPAPAAAGEAHGRAQRIRRLLRYTAVNLVSLAIDYAVFLWLTHAFSIPVIASTIGYAVAFAVNYRLSRRFVFGTDGTHKGEKRLFAEFMASGALGIVLTAAVTGAGVYLLDLAPAIAKTAAVLISFVTLYIVRSRLVFTPIA